MASIRSVVLVSFVCFQCSSYYISVEGGRRLTSNEEGTELEKQLKLLNKPAIKSFQTQYGDIYDCVNFYKQPAFDHPLLKNHTFHPQMRPNLVPKLMMEKELFNATINSKASYAGLNRVDCPPGTVPIKRVTKDDLIREKLHSERYGSKYHALPGDPGTHYAVVQTILDPKNKYYGAGTSFAIYNPLVMSPQYSASRMKIQIGPESIQVGWTVNPTLYGDNNSRLYIYLNAGQSRCFNTRCPGFVIVDSKTPLDSVLPISHKGGKAVLEKSLIFRDDPVGNWWLEVGEDNTKIGFWPARLFTGLSDIATKVDWGGEVFSPPELNLPPMGSGDFPVESTEKDAFCERITTVNESHELVDAVNTEEEDDVECYEPIDEGKLKGEWRHLVFFGGPGGPKSYCFSSHDMK